MFGVPTVVEFVTLRALDQVGGPIAKICPRAPGNANQYKDQLTGYVLWGVLALLLVGVVVGVGAVVAGRVFAMPHASKVGVISVVVVFLAAVAYMVLPSMITGITGAGCV